MKKNLLVPNLNAATHWMNQKVTREGLIGAPSLIHFWAISCSKCKNALPVIQSIREKYPQELNVVAIHMPLSEADLDVNEVAHVAADYSITEPILIDNKHHLADLFGNRFVPAYYLFDAGGHLVEYHLGERGALRIYKATDRLLHR
ncbi:TlpA family protein disulfide reductase [Sporolactobacillus kofuensis]|uniref:TlpA family protein disulfide reductase n=1 Tax=Sporolactobacillus kofuensis TaxID=269672 RepID=A0ABW1WH24_9BACL|nr:TlpA disulfide reductase family protein [Sporolactobacillus kofuensis]MCO7175313.1 TlpA family protein disulfide reductase [Sporolactobacillus kofuensis]